MSEPKPEERRSIDGLDHQPSFESDQELKKALISVSNPLALLEMAHDAIIVRDVNSVVQFWNRGALDLYGWTSEEASGQMTHSFLKTKFPVSKEDVDWALLNVGHWEGDLIHSRKDGARIHVSSRQALRRTEDGKPVFILEINRDVTHNAYLKLLQEAAVAASEASTIEDAVRTCLRSICVHTGWCVGRACVITLAENGEVRCNDLWHTNEDPRYEPFREFQGKNPLALEEGLAGRVMKTRAPLWITEVQKDRYFSTGAVARDAGICTAFGMPITAGSEVVAVLELFSENPVDANHDFVGVLSNVGRQLGRVFERVIAEEAQRRLSVSLLRSQDDERRRIARELHDSVGQYLAGVSMCVDGARKAPGGIPSVALEKLNEASEMAKKCETEVRTLSYLLHPPLLEELGLASATNWFVQGFADRSGINVTVDLSPGLGRLDHAVELTLFRILQECLTNIHRHSRSKTATVKMFADEKNVYLEVVDQGTGIPKRTLDSWSLAGPRGGIGIRGMRERLKDLGGSLQIDASKKGTTVRAAVPITARDTRN